ncbi:MAG: type II secretion system protein [Phycisphaerales bacterium]
MNRRGFHRGFTLVEMLVSIGVIAVLVGLMLPALKGSADSARRVTCGANLRTLHAGTTMWMDANDGLLPFADLPADFAAGFVAPFEAIAATLDVPLPERVDGSFEPRDPWACEADDEASKVFGTSYRYAPMDFFGAMGEHDRARVSKLFTDTPDGVLFIDLFPFHGDGTGGRHTVRMAGHVAPLDERGLLPGVR